MIRPRHLFRLLSVATGVLLAVGVLAGLTLSLGVHGENTHRALLGERAPALRGSTLDGSSYVLRPTGHLTLVNIWAAWCAPCRDEIPLLARAAADYRSQGVRLVTVDTRDGPVAARALLSDANAQDLVAVVDPHGRLAVSWGATGVPETVVVDGQGIVRARRIGAVSREWLDSQVRRWS
ncbi:MAG TPA: redoxin domain-containing protein [Nocardioides sp.]|uniref:TlpA family protein disulfide reductase n=1 Tax=Nocardioides sp. TaxID=35761 RepID=UPI002F421578